MAERTISLAELGEHVGELRRIHREAITSDDDTPELSFADVRARCHAILGMLDRAEGRTSDADIDDPDEPSGQHPVVGGPQRRGNDQPPRVRGTLPPPTNTASDRMSLSELHAPTKAETRRAVAALLGTPPPEDVVEGLLARSHIRSGELRSRKLKK